MEGNKREPEQTVSYLRNSICELVAQIEDMNHLNRIYVLTQFLYKKER